MYCTHKDNMVLIHDIHHSKHKISTFLYILHLFVKTAAEWVDELPHDIDGFKLYKTKC